MNELLKANGFKIENDKAIKKPKDNTFREAWIKGKWRILLESHDCPFWTIQKKTGDSVLWFVDFPLEVGARSVLEFIKTA